MKSLFYLCKTSCTLLIIFFILPSCTDSSTTQNTTTKDSTTQNSTIQDSTIQDSTTKNAKPDSTQVSSAFHPEDIWITGIYIFGNPKLEDDQGHPKKNRLSQRNETIHWRIKPTSGVDRITEIAMDTHVTPNMNVFSVLPQPQGNLKHWQATIANLDSDKSFEEKYYIKWVRKNSTKTRTFDPKIQLNPATFIPPDSSEKK